MSGTNCNDCIGTCSTVAGMNAILENNNMDKELYSIIGYEGSNFEDHHYEAWYPLGENTLENY